MECVGVELSVGWLLQPLMLQYATATLTAMNMGTAALMSPM